MNLRQLYEYGRIVPGVNTTADVGPNEITKQAKKLGFKVDKDGRPPTLSKKVKGSSTNVLFNLGMTESVDKPHKDVLYYDDMNEALGQLNQDSKIYIDMDGVLADFFGEWAKLMNKTSWTDIKDINPALQKIRDTDDFWLNLPLTSNAKNLLSIVKKVKGSYTILSSPLADDPKSEPHKREWIKKNLSFFPPEDIIITTNKAKYATNGDVPNILIDDYGVNINQWESAGGIGFKHKDHKFTRTIKNLKKVETKVYARKQLPQIGEKDLADLDYTLEFIDPKLLFPVQEERDLTRLDKKLTKFKSGEFKPIVIDEDNNIINGHHRYDVAIMQQVECVPVYKIKNKLHHLLEANHFKNPKNTFLTKADTAYDFLRVGKTISNLKAVPKGANRDEPDVMVVPFGGKKEKKHLKKHLSRVGYKTQDADKTGDDAHVDENLRPIAKPMTVEIFKEKADLYIKGLIGGFPKEEMKQKLNTLLRKAIKSGNMSQQEGVNYIKNRIKEYLDFVKKNPGQPLPERELTKGEENKKEKYVKGMKKNKNDFKDRYGKDAEAVMYATATKMAKEAVRSGKYTPDQIIEILENFADGKKKGKSRPGRVKRSGASCNGSVTALRRRAKNSSGEKAKMYHWCANMKSGRKKSK